MWINGIQLCSILIFDGSTNCSFNYVSSSFQFHKSFSILSSSCRLCRNYWVNFSSIWVVCLAVSFNNNCQILLIEFCCCIDGCFCDSAVYWNRLWSTSNWSNFLFNSWRCSCKHPEHFLCRFFSSKSYASCSTICYCNVFMIWEEKETNYVISYLIVSTCDTINVHK